MIDQNMFLQKLRMDKPNTAIDIRFYVTWEPPRVFLVACEGVVRWTVFWYATLPLDTRKLYTPNLLQLYHLC